MYLWGAGGGDRVSGAELEIGSGGFMQVSGGFVTSDTTNVYVGSCGLSPYNNGSSMIPGVFGGAPNEAGGSYSVSVVVMSPLMVKELVVGGGTVIAVAGGGGAMVIVEALVG